MTAGPLLTADAAIERHRAILRDAGRLTPEGWRDVAETARRTLAGRVGTRRRDSIPAASRELVEAIIAGCEVEARALEAAAVE